MLGPFGSHLQSAFTQARLRIRLGQLRWTIWIELVVILIAAIMYGGVALLDFNPAHLQQTGEHNESSTLPLLAEIGVWRYHEIPLWNPFMLTGFPHAGDLVNHFWNPVSTLAVLLWGGINGMKVSVFVSLVLAGIGQWLFAHVFGLRGIFRLWAALLFMLSGGLALLWQVGWYELLLGAVWFPWCFAFLWWSLGRRDKTCLVLCAFCVTIVLSSGGGYYPVYLLGSAAVLVVLALVLARRGERLLRLRRAALIALISAGLSAVILLPAVDGMRYTRRDASLDLGQQTSQSIPYALVNFIVSKPDWFRTTILDNASGTNWFYVGALPLAALALVPLTLYSRRRRGALVAVAVLTLFILAWHSNRHTPFHYVYQALPFLYQLRFPGRLLIIATSPLLVLAALGLQHTSHLLRRASRTVSIALPTRAGGRVHHRVDLRWLVSAACLSILFLSVGDAYTVNKAFAYSPGQIDPQSFQAMNLLKEYDPDLYYISLGGGQIVWGWTPAAYMMEIPVINFQYNRHLASADARLASDSPIVAGPKYMLTMSNESDPPDADQIGDYGLRIWRVRDALPYAFAVPRPLPTTARSLQESMLPFKARLDGPNRIVAQGTSERGRQLVVLMSDYPGWRLMVDGQPAQVVPVNGYLGATTLEGEHTYTFVFAPALFYYGLYITMSTLLLCLVMMAADLPLHLAWAQLGRALRRLRFA